MSKDQRVSQDELWRGARAVTTLQGAHDALVKVMPAPEAVA
ncbi:hypothetical protein B0I31_105175 [Saccharothrix carnea]|uniref:Uncharacterized protein n=1 Tax=Saccharothrix carnea TaxID=1280637 RepID=A0A2P8I9S4_SACCR|nr:hypothetical protein [Saccharothrix carnea]PSL55216.1 hypothetical protein B0I31_105175 [Saccharothrix carnea]